MMKKFSQITEGLQSSDVHSDLKKFGPHQDQGGGYHLYSPKGSASVSDVKKTLQAHGFQKMRHNRHGERLSADQEIYERTPAPYHTETVRLTHGDFKVQHIHRSVQRG